MQLASQPADADAFITWVLQIRGADAASDQESPERSTRSIQNNFMINAALVASRLLQPLADIQYTFLFAGIAHTGV